MLKVLEQILRFAQDDVGGGLRMTEGERLRITVGGRLKLTVKKQKFKKL